MKVVDMTGQPVGESDSDESFAQWVGFVNSYLHTINAALQDSLNVMESQKNYNNDLHTAIAQLEKRIVKLEGKKSLWQKIWNRMRH